VPPLSLAIFDFDGTLADSLAVFTLVMNEAADRFGFSRLDTMDVGELRKLGPREVASRMRLPLWKSPVIAPFVRRRMAEESDRTRLFAGVPEMLDALADGGVALAVVSSNAESTVRRLLGDRLAGRIAYYGCGASVLGKRRFLRRALALTGTPAARTIKIGDELRDLEAARAERLRFGGVSWGFADPDALRAGGVDVMFERVEEIVEYVVG
jgi:phosphoglycolate phosphatase